MPNSLSFFYQNWHRRKENLKLLASGVGINQFRPSLSGEDVVVWGWSDAQYCINRGKNVLVMEHGYLGDRNMWVSLGWNGLNGHANFYTDEVLSDRWEHYWKKGMQRWRGDVGDYVLLCGQVYNDATLSDCPDYKTFLYSKARELCDKYGKVVFRPHPRTTINEFTEFDKRVEISNTLKTTLLQDMKCAKLVVAWSSNSLVEAMYNGVPFESNSPFSMVHGYNNGVEEPDREDWGRKIAYCQWSRQELASGGVWNHVKTGTKKYIKEAADPRPKITFHCRTTSTQRPYIDWLTLGTIPGDVKVSTNAKNVATWGWRAGMRLAERSKNVLVVEHGYLGDRNKWISLGWNGLNGHANFYTDNVPPDRWEQYWKKGMQRWRGDVGDYVLLCGQVPGDMSMIDCPDYEEFLESKMRKLIAKYGRVVFRPHPRAIGGRQLNLRYPPKLEIADPSRSSLTQDLQQAKLVVAWSSNALVEAMYNGVPFESNSPFSMVHNYSTDCAEPDRDEWGRKIAYSQWSIEELKNGTAWNHIKVGCVS